MMSALNTVNILVTLDENYLPYLNVMLSTLIRFNPDCFFDTYLLHTSIGQDALKPTEAILGNAGRLIPMQAHNLELDQAPTTSRYPKEIMLMNLAILRREQNFEDVFRFIEKRKNFLVLPDQDIISGLYGSKIYALDTFRYNMTERLYQMHAPFEKGLDIEWVRKNSVIIHYCGRNKPWKENYVGQLDVFYKEAVKRLAQET